MPINIKYKVLVIGDSWNGSDCTGLARGFRDLNCLVDHVGEDQFFPKTSSSVTSKIFLRLFKSFFKYQFNLHIIKSAQIFQPDIILVFKGNHINIKTLDFIKQKSWLINFYPDISLTNHSSVDPDTFALYDHIFSTKSFALKDYKNNLGLNKVSFLPHGCDPRVHRHLKEDLSKEWINDVSFIGAWSSNKESILNSLKTKLPEINLKIWGNGWESNQSKCLNSSIWDIQSLEIYTQWQLMLVQLIWVYCRKKLLVPAQVI